MTATDVANLAWGENEPEPVTWSCGAWSLELRGDELADLRFDGSVVLRSVRAVARDRNWGTVPSVVDSLDASDSRIRIGVGMRGLGADITGTLTVSVLGDRIAVDFAAAVHDDFWSNRLGLVVLHPPTAAGAVLIVTAPDGESTTTTFAERISPHQPAFDIARLEWTDGGVASVLEFTGEIFEMEDQRNWTDASYKTYSTPLALPFPVLRGAGTRISQSIELDSRRTRGSDTGQGIIPVRLTPSHRRVPQFTTTASTSAGNVPDGASRSSGALLIELDARSTNWRAALDRALVEAAGRSLDVRLVVDAADQLDPLLDALDGVPMVRLGAFSSMTHISEEELWRALRRRAPGRALGASDGTAFLGGTRGHFTELNRTIDRIPTDVDALTFSITPQMHATNRQQLVESIAMQRIVAENAVALAGGLPVHVGPVTLRARFNAVATSGDGASASAGVEQGYGAEPTPDATDPRQSSDALAAWTIASAAALAVWGVASISYFESWGARGTHGFPVQQAVDWLAEIDGAPLLEVGGTLPTGVWVLAAVAGDAPVALVANVSDEDAVVELHHGTDWAQVTTVSVEALSTRRIPLG